jgi:hypothetical protein
MAKIIGLDIPAGLEFLYSQALTLKNLLSVDIISRRTYSRSWITSILISNRSLFVRWESLWDSFASGRKNAWRDYWVTLPFGSHAGAGGWPGSGYSAFVYVNAPRFKAGLDLLLDPPFINLIHNGDFSSGAEGWDYHLFDFTSNRANFDPAGEFAFLQTAGSYLFSLYDGDEYHLSFYHEISGQPIFVTIIDNETAKIYFQSGPIGFTGVFSDTFTASSDSVEVKIVFEPEPFSSGFIDDVVLHKV